jgi:hypothetical protein
MEKDLLYDELLQSRHRYKRLHNLSAWDLPLSLHIFTTGYHACEHLATAHGMTRDGFALAKDKLDFWSLKLNISKDNGLWSCGYCGVVGADWDDRLEHIKRHWMKGGPRLTKRHPWMAEKASLDHIDTELYFKDLAHGKRPDTTRPSKFFFSGYQVYEAAIWHRAKLNSGHPRRYETPPLPVYPATFCFFDT